MSPTLTLRVKNYMPTQNGGEWEKSANKKHDQELKDQRQQAPCPKREKERSAWAAERGERRYEMQTGANLGNS